MASDATQQDTRDSEKLVDEGIAEFLLEDYQQRVTYLTGHFQRMWTRFNFFITIEAAVAAFMLTSDRTVATFAPVLVLVEVFISVIWWTFGAQDRFLVRIYRKQVRDASDKLMHIYKQMYRTFPIYLENYRYVGSVDEGAKDLLEEDLKRGKNIRWSPFEWRSQSISITRLAAIFPVVILVLWVIMGVLLFILPLANLP